MATGPTTERYADRLVLALDGLDYRDIAAARARGLFPSFRAPSRLVSTFPSISDIAWHDIFGLVPPAGYQRVYYSAARNTMVGGTLDAIRPIEFEERMDLAFSAKLHHLGAYLMSGPISKREVNIATERFFDIHGRRTVYVYNVGPDALQHTRGNLDAYLTHLSKKLEALSTEYRARVGHALEIVIVSDHGHNHATSARFFPIADVLAAHGFHAARSLESPGDVAFSVDGVTTGFGVFTRADDVDTLANVIVATTGVDVVTVRESATRFRVMAQPFDTTLQRVGARSVAFVETRMRGTTVTYRYRPTLGDPLGYMAIVRAIREASGADADGFAPESVWVRHSATARFPVAPVRIARGHTNVTLNPAPILVSVADGYRVGLGAVSVVNRLRPLGGTHGSLSATDALGVTMTNFVDTKDATTASVRAQLGGFDDLRALLVAAPSVALMPLAIARQDRFSEFAGALGTASDTTHRNALLVALTPVILGRVAARGNIVADVTEVAVGGGATTRADSSRTISTWRWPVRDLISGAAGAHLLVVIDDVLAKALELDAGLTPGPRAPGARRPRAFAVSISVTRDDDAGAPREPVGRIVIDVDGNGQIISR